MQMICQQCGRTFDAKPSQVKKGRKYCSKTCHDIAQCHKVEVFCEYCRTPIRRSPSMVAKRNFCCNQHRLLWLSRYVKENINIPGHSAGHKAPHLTELNKKRNPLFAVELNREKRGEYDGKRHRRIMEGIIGRKLSPEEDVHHINGVRNDNRLENLIIMSHTDHMKLHGRIATERFSTNRGDAT